MGEIRKGVPATLQSDTPFHIQEDDLYCDLLSQYAAHWPCTPKTYTERLADLKAPNGSIDPEPDPR